MHENLRIKLTKNVFRIAAKYSDRLRPRESETMYELYEKAIVAELTNIQNGTFYNSFSETFGGDKLVSDFSSRYNRSIQLENNERERIVTWSNITNHGLTPNQTSYSFVRLTIDGLKITKVEHSDSRKKKSELVDMGNPSYNEIGEDNLNRWYFLEFIYKEIREIKLKNKLVN